MFGLSYAAGLRDHRLGRRRLAVLRTALTQVGAHTVRTVSVSETRQVAARSHVTGTLSSYQTVGFATTSRKAVAAIARPEDDRAMTPSIAPPPELVSELADRLDAAAVDALDSLDLPDRLSLNEEEKGGPLGSVAMAFLTSPSLA